MRGANPFVHPEEKRTKGTETAQKRTSESPSWEGWEAGNRFRRECKKLEPQVATILKHQRKGPSNPIYQKCDKCDELRTHGGTVASYREL